MNFELILATSNIHKVKEIREILAPHGIVLYGLGDVNLHPEEAIENGDSYFENALIKANAVAKLTSMPIIADDSGLEILALNNQPGLHSARYAEQCGGHKNAIKQIISDLKDKKDRSARFICDIVLINVEERPLLFEGIAEGEIIEESKGEGGFGYDPIFYSKDLNKTFSEASEEEKNLYSHRGKALKKLLAYLRISQLIKK